MTNAVRSIYVLEAAFKPMINATGLKDGSTVDVNRIDRLILLYFEGKVQGYNSISYAGHPSATTVAMSASSKNTTTPKQMSPHLILVHFEWGAKARFRRARTSFRYPQPLTTTVLSARAS